MDRTRPLCDTLLEVRAQSALLARGKRPTHDRAPCIRLPSDHQGESAPMKLVRFGPPGREKPGIVDSKGNIRDLSKVVPDIAGDALSPKGLAKIRKAADRQTAARARQSPARPPASAESAIFIAIGLNYSDHAAEAGMAIPKEPIIFNKAQLLHLRAERRHHHAEGLDQARLGGRARHRHRPARALPVQRQGDGRGRRLLPGQRRVGARVPDRARRPMDQGQGLRDVRAARPLAGDQGRDQGPAEPQHVARRQRREAPEAATPRP